MIFVCTIGTISIESDNGFGLLEALGFILCFVIIVHLVTQMTINFTKSHHTDSVKRTANVLKDHAVIIMSSCLILLIVGASLAPCKSDYFSKLGEILLIGFSYILIFLISDFPTLLHIVGPSENQGDIKSMINKFRKQKPLQRNKVENILEKFDVQTPRQEDIPIKIIDDQWNSLKPSPEKDIVYESTNRYETEKLFNSTHNPTMEFNSNMKVPEKNKALQNMKKSDGKPFNPVINNDDF